MERSGNRRGLAPLIELTGGLVEDFESRGAMGVISVDAAPIGEVEQRFGARAFVNCIAALEKRIWDWAKKQIGETECVGASVGGEVIALFFGRAHDDVEFLSDRLPSLSEELKGFLQGCLHQIVYPYLNPAPELAVGHSFGLYRPYLRHQGQIDRLLRSARETGHFNLLRAKRELEDALRSVILRGSIRSVYEPILDLKTRIPIGYESLSRGPAGSGLESPMRLFGIADSCDLTYELDALCRRKAVENQPIIAPGLRLFVNILPSSLKDPDFDSSLLGDLLGTLNLRPQAVVLEISEREAIDNYPIFREAIDNLTRLGFGIALDDVGAGFNSLQAALELNPDFLKVDMSIVRGIDESPEKQEIVSGLCSFSARLDAALIAEGIETRQEHQTLIKLGVPYGQGFLFRPPS